MLVQFSVCLLGDGIFMECKKACWKTFSISLSGIIILIISLYYLIEINKLKEILFYDYSFENIDAINEEINSLGFKYTMNFQELPEKKILNENLQIQNYSYRGTNCIILFSNSSTCEKQIKSILNSKTEMILQKIHLPDDIYNEQFVNVSLWNLNDKRIYMFSYNNICKTYIEKQEPHI